MRTRTDLKPIEISHPSLWGMGLTILLLHVLGWGIFVTTVLPQNYVMGDGSGVFGLGLAVTAYVLGVRHAFDADHIAAIDNTARKLASSGAQTGSTGFWFALGHSTVVVVAVALLAAGVDLLTGQMADDGPVLREFADVWGPAVSGGFLILIGTINLSSLVGICGVFKLVRKGIYREQELERQLNQRGLVSRLLAPLSRRIDKPWKMYPLGLLFGLGLDTATTIGLFIVAGGAVVMLPWFVVMVLPVLFAAGMVLFDTIDGVLMSCVYRWALNRPVRKVLYNVTVTAVSVVVAYLVGAVVLGGLVADTMGIDVGPIAWIASINLQHFGFVVAGIFTAAWLAAYAIWKIARLDSVYITEDWGVQGDNSELTTAGAQASSSALYEYRANV